MLIVECIIVALDMRGWSWIYIVCTHTFQEFIALGKDGKYTQSLY